MYPGTRGPGIGVQMKKHTHLQLMNASAKLSGILLPRHPVDGVSIFLVASETPEIFRRTSFGNSRASECT